MICNILKLVEKDPKLNKAAKQQRLNELKQTHVLKLRDYQASLQHMQTSKNTFTNAIKQYQMAQYIHTTKAMPQRTPLHSNTIPQTINKGVLRINPHINTRHSNSNTYSNIHSIQPHSFTPRQNQIVLSTRHPTTQMYPTHTIPTQHLSPVQSTQVSNLANVRQIQPTNNVQNTQNGNI